jgi:hypothetical protein
LTASITWASRTAANNALLGGRNLASVSLFRPSFDSDVGFLNPIALLTGGLSLDAGPVIAEPGKVLLAEGAGRAATGASAMRALMSQVFSNTDPEFGQEVLNQVAEGMGKTAAERLEAPLRVLAAAQGTGATTAVAVAGRSIAEDIANVLVDPRLTNRLIQKGIADLAQPVRSR